MLKNNLLIAIRSFWKNKGITSINVLGLAIGISATLIIFLIIQYDYSFDKWEPTRTVFTVFIQNLKTEAIPVFRRWHHLQ